ncbi:MAG: SGNH/GDSL hydrolase family protein [Pseudomonadota bacterium]
MSGSENRTQPGQNLLGQLAFVFYVVITTLLVLELLLRGYFALQIGPRVLAYGTPWYRNAIGEHRKRQLATQYDRELAAWNENEDNLDMVSEHENAKGGYLKFFPNEPRYFKDIDSGEVVRVKINAHGFRGDDYTIDKPEGVIRVLTLGASSTFGFYSRDGETYPHYLEERLNARCQDDDKRFQVINFAIPHARAEEIRSMLVAEGLSLSPDVITFYEGRNDSYRIHPMDFRQAGAAHTQEMSGALERAWSWVTRVFVLMRFADELSSTSKEVTADRALESLNAVSERTSRAFIADMDEIRQLAHQRGIVFVVANQQANSKSWFGIPVAERYSMKGVTYSEEVANIERILGRGEAISGYEFNFLIHDRLMRDLESWARENELPFVDVIRVLDQERHHLVSWVHLDAYGNGLIADAFADEILVHVCSDRPQSR